MFVWIAMDLVPLAFEVSSFIIYKYLASFWSSANFTDKKEIFIVFLVSGNAFHVFHTAIFLNTETIDF